MVLGRKFVHPVSETAYLKKRIDAEKAAYPSGWNSCRNHFGFQRFRMIRIPSSTISSSMANPRGIMW